MSHRPAGLEQVEVVAIGDEHRAGVEAMFSRCSESTLFHRFHGPTRGAPSHYLDDALSGGSGRLVLGGIGAGDVGFGIAESNRRPDGTAEFAMLVEDLWQAHGVGSLLLIHLARAERQAGTRALSASVLEDDRWTIPPLSGLGSLTAQFERGGYQVTIDLARPLAS